MMLGLAAGTGRSKPQFGNKLWKHLMDKVRAGISLNFIVAHDRRSSMHACGKTPCVFSYKDVRHRFKPGMRLVRLLCHAKD